MLPSASQPLVEARSAGMCSGEPSATKPPWAACFKPRSGVGLGGDSSPRMVAIQVKLEF
jgi:hypothetical protein